MTDTDFFQVLVVVTAIFFPPLSVFLERGCGSDFLLNFLLSCLGFFPGAVHACFIVYRSESALVYNPHSYAPSTLASALGKGRLTGDDILRAASDEDREERRKIRVEGRAGGDDEKGWSGARGRAPSYRSTVTGPPAYDAPSSDEDGSEADEYRQQAQMSEKRRGKQAARERDQDFYV
ncbi:plasma membrane proteolipid Pmp3 [Rhodotorula kratochvilovae]